MTKQPHHPEMIIVYLESTQTRNAKGELCAEVGIVKWGERGYHKTTYGLQTPEWVKWYNEERLENDPAETWAMEGCSIFNVWQNYAKILAAYDPAKHANSTTRRANASSK